MSRDEILELLLDLKHDLGKYLLLPVAMLPKDASRAELRQALQQALLRTRKSGSSIQTARGLWEAFVEEAGDTLRYRAGFRRLTAAVDVALGWERALESDGDGEGRVGGEDGGPLERSGLERDLGGVSRAIGDLIEEIKGEASE